MEGALKLKEISYIHAEAYAAGELKHGPLALVDDDMPVVAVAPNNELLEKLKSNLQEVRARGGELFVFADPNRHRARDGVHVITMPQHVELLPGAGRLHDPAAAARLSRRGAARAPTSISRAISRRASPSSERRRPRGPAVRRSWSRHGRAAVASCG